MMGEDITAKSRKMHTEEQFIAIQEIHDLLVDSCKSYKTTSQRVDDDRAKALLLQISSKRKTMASELAQDLMQHDPYDKPRHGTLGGSIHRILLTFRDILNNTNEVNILVECEGQDSELLGRYTKVLDTIDLNEATRGTLSRQYLDIEQTLHQVAASRGSMEAVHF